MCGARPSCLGWSSLEPHLVKQACPLGKHASGTTTRHCVTPCSSACHSEHLRSCARAAMLPVLRADDETPGIPLHWRSADPVCAQWAVEHGVAPPSSRQDLGCSWSRRQRRSCMWCSKCVWAAMQGGRASGALPARPHLGAPGRAAVRDRPRAVAAGPGAAGRRACRVSPLDDQGRPRHHRLPVRC